MPKEFENIQSKYKRGQMKENKFAGEYMCSRIWIALLPQESSQIGSWLFLIEKVKGPYNFLSAKTKKACLPPTTNSFLIQNSDRVKLHVTFKNGHEDKALLR